MVDTPYTRPYPHEEFQKKLPSWVDPNIKIDEDAFLFLGDRHERSVSLLGRQWFRGVFTTMGVIIVAVGNKVAKRPLTAGIPMYFIGGFIGWSIGNYGQKKRDRALAERDLTYFHYITLHPEDFPPKERVKFRDYLTVWEPIR